MGWQAPRWVQALFTKSDAGAAEPPPVVYNKSTGLPSVQSTVARAAHFEAKRAKEEIGWIQSGGITSAPRSAPNQARGGHPAGSAMHDQREDYRRGWRSRRAEGGPPQRIERVVIRPPVRDLRDEARDRRNDPPPLGWAAPAEPRGERPYQERPYQPPPGR